MVDDEWEKKFWTGKPADRLCMGHGVVRERTVIRGMSRNLEVTSDCEGSFVSSGVPSTATSPAVKKRKIETK